MSYRHFLWLFVFFMLSAFPAVAQAPDVATPERVAIAFYKMAGLQPSFSSWAKDTSEYRHTPVARRARVEAKIAEKLMEEYQEFTPDRHLLNVATTATVTLSEQADPDNPELVHYMLRWDLASENDEFFPYEHRDTLFALMPQGVEAYREAPITREQYLYIKERMGPVKRHRILLHMRAQQAHGDEPVRIFGENTWVLTTAMAGVTLWDAKGGLLWERSADWYVSPETQTLNDLKQARDAED